MATWDTQPGSHTTRMGSRGAGPGVGVTLQEEVPICRLEVIIKHVKIQIESHLSGFNSVSNHDAKLFATV